MQEKFLSAIISRITERRWIKEKFQQRPLNLAFRLFCCTQNKHPKSHLFCSSSSNSLSEVQREMMAVRRGKKIILELWWVCTVGWIPKIVREWEKGWKKMKEPDERKDFREWWASHSFTTDFLSPPNLVLLPSSCDIEIFVERYYNIHTHSWGDVFRNYFIVFG